jgi:probable F420-dependent oxidoreductase
MTAPAPGSSPVPPRPFRFGVQASRARDRAEWVDLARRAEGNGYAVLTMPDHFDEQLAPVPALMCAADATSSLRVGALVWDNDYKHPLVLAKELATMDVLSDGRLEIGLGAGWMIADYDASGITYDRAGVRIDRFEEGLAVIKGLMGSETFSYSGRHYTITDHRGTPAPVQRPCPPVLIGGGGKRVLSIAAREADIVGINGTMHAGVVGPDAIATMTSEAVDGKVAIVREAAGDRIADIEMNIRVFMVNVTDDRPRAIEGLANALSVDTSMIEQSPFALIGPPSKIIEDLLERRERWGFSYIIVGAADVESFAPVVAELSGR